MTGSGDGLREWAKRLRDVQPSPEAHVAAIDHVGAIDPVAAMDADALDNEVSFAAAHTRRYIATDGEDDGWEGPRPILILYTTGRRSGHVRRNPLLYLEHEGERMVIGSKGGSPGHPSWFLNLRADPGVHVRVMADVYAASAEVLSSTERAAVWPHLVERYPMFADYQARTEREIPLVRLVPTDRAGANP